MDHPQLILFGFIIGLAGFIILFIIIFLIISKVIKSNPTNAIFLLLGFLLTAYLYPSGFKGVIDLTRKFFLESYQIVGVTDTSEDQVESDTLIVLAYNSDLWYSSLIFVCLFILISVFASFISGLLNQGMFPKNNIFIKNFIVSSVLVLALYFSISSIIAVPIVSYRSIDTTNFVVELEEELDKYSEGDSILEQEHMTFIDDKRLRLFQHSYVDSLSDSAAIGNYPISADLYSNSVNEGKTVFRDIRQIKDRAIARMKIANNSNITTQLKAQDKNELSGWYLENRATLLNSLNDQKTRITIVTERLSQVPDKRDEGISIIYEQAVLAAAASPSISKIPPRPFLGSDLGVFKFFTGWLLSVESYPLVIIIGLIGFGLLGAGGCTFIREQSKDDKQTLIDDLAGVLIKGFTAAIVVFLGVQGGLAILTTNTAADLNAYALFFVAFVAAVFSDEAWNWAKNRFASNFGSANNPPAKNMEKNNLPSVDDQPIPPRLPAPGSE